MSEQGRVDQALDRNFAEIENWGGDLGEALEAWAAELTAALEAGSALAEHQVAMAQVHADFESRIAALEQWRTAHGTGHP